MEQITSSDVWGGPHAFAIRTNRWRVHVPSFVNGCVEILAPTRPIRSLRWARATGCLERAVAMRCRRHACTCYVPGFSNNGLGAIPPRNNSNSSSKATELRRVRHLVLPQTSVVMRKGVHPLCMDIRVSGNDCFRQACRGRGCCWLVALLLPAFRSPLPFAATDRAGLLT